MEPEGQATWRPSSVSQSAMPSADEIHAKALSVFQKRPCMWQINVCLAVLAGEQDIISIAGTGAGKTLSFWLPLLCRPTSIQIVVTPLNILGQQNIDTLSRAGVHGIFISAKTATRRNFEVRDSFFSFLIALMNVIMSGHC
jgi:superfamily II DNA helicase RecQ